MTTTFERRYDIDWLRVITIGLLLIYHIAIVFQPWGVFIGFIQSSKSLEWLWTPMAMLNVWRIPILFFVSGMGVCFAIRKRNWKQLLLERSKRILLPLLFGVFAIVPIHIFIFQKHYGQELSYTANTSHLWFLANIFIYVIILSPVFYYLKLNRNTKIVLWVKNTFSKPLGLLIASTLFVIEALLINTDNYVYYASNLHGFILGFIAFLFGFMFVFAGKKLWQNFLKLRWLFLTLAVTMFALRLLVFELNAPNYLMAIESNLWVYGIFGFAYKHLNNPSKVLAYLSKSAYPIYIIHMAFLYLASLLILPLEINNFLQFVLVVVFTFTGCFAFYEFAIKRFWLKILFGLKNN